QLVWVAGNRVVFPWEKKGWTHLYAEPVAGRAPTFRTRGELEDEDVRQRPDASTLVDRANQDDSDRGHLCIVAVIGQATGATQLAWHYNYYSRTAHALNQCLASQGYTVLSVNCRSGIGYGMEFREALHYGAQGASEFNAVLGAGVYLRARADVDPARIGLWGG